MPKFDSKTWNDKVFQKYLRKVEPTRENSLINDTILNRTTNKMARALDEQVGGNYIVEPIKGDLTGKVQNYDGKTDFVYNSRDTFEQGKPIVGRMKGWTEMDFSSDITGGEDFMPMAEEVKRYFEGVDFDDLIAIFNGIFAMNDSANNNFVSKHTYTVSALTETTMNEAITHAGGDKKNKYKIAFMNSLTALPLEKLGAEYLKYTDKDGITRNLSVAQYNGILVVVDDLIPENTIYIVGDKFIDVDKLPVDKADYMEYDRTKNGGTELYSHKERTLYSPRYISFTKKSVASLSATSEELAKGENWEVVNNGKSGGEKVTVDNKLIPIARIVINPVSSSSTQTETTSTQNK